MNYRELGNTGLHVSEISLGCEGFNGKDSAGVRSFVDVCVQYGINYIDLYTPDPEVRTKLGEALSGRRDQFIMQAHLCTVWKNGQYERTRNIEEVKAGFEDLLKQLQTDYIEVGMIHYVDSLEDWNKVEQGAVMQYAKELKAEGKIKHIGLSSHNPTAALQAVKSGLIEVLMFSINPCYDLQPPNEDVNVLWEEKSYEGRLFNMDAERENLYETCQRNSVGITVMKAFGGGDLLSENSPAGKALTPYQCLYYALTRPGVATVLVGAHTEEELKECACYADAPDTEKDYASVFNDFPKISWAGHCMYCGHCAPCPRGIDIAGVTKFLNLAKAQEEIPETVREHYNLLSHKAGECIECGACESRCPFQVSVRQNMKKAKELFGK